jgi:hypothetical protein
MRDAIEELQFLLAEVNLSSSHDTTIHLVVS